MGDIGFSSHGSMSSAAHAILGPKWSRPSRLFIDSNLAARQRTHLRSLCAMPHAGATIRQLTAVACAIFRNNGEADHHLTYAADESLPKSRPSRGCYVSTTPTY